MGLAGDAETLALRHHRDRLARGEPLARLQVRLAQPLAGLQRPCQRATDREFGANLEVKEALLAEAEAIDVSRGLGQAKAALRYCIARLGSDDRFDILRFSSDVERFSSNGLIAASFSA